MQRERGEQDAQISPQRQAREASEVVSGGGKDGVVGVAGGMREVVAAHAMLGLEMADARLDGGAAAQVAFDRCGDAPFLAGDVDLEPVLDRGVVAVATMLRIALR